MIEYNSTTSSSSIIEYPKNTDMYILQQPNKYISWGGLFHFKDYNMMFIFKFWHIQLHPAFIYPISIPFYIPSITPSIPELNGVKWLTEQTLVRQSSGQTTERLTDWEPFLDSWVEVHNCYQLVQWYVCLFRGMAQCNSY